MSLSEAMLLADIRQRLFSPIISATPRAVGAELELIPVHQATNKPVLARGDSGPSTVDVLSRLARRQGWLEQPAEDDPPSWKLPDGSCISFEPGGQLEVSSAPHDTASSLIRSLQNLVALVREAMSEAEIVLLARGVDPYNSIDAVPLQLHRDRYARMTRYFDSIGPSGVRMMRQTAALQLNVERGSDPLPRWRLLNAVAPIAVALFANSRTYAGASTGWSSYRSHLWRTLDESRTGIVYNESDSPARYLRFALDAVAIRSGDDRVPYRTFREWMREREVEEEDWLFHLSTLFPEVRPKDYFELRSADTIETKWLAAPVVLVAGLVYDEASARRASELLGLPSSDLLEHAGLTGLGDPTLRKTARAIANIALDGATTLGENYVSASDIETARDYFKRAFSNP